MLRQKIDDKLKELNDDYAVERNSALKDIYVKVLPEQKFMDFMRLKGKIGGQHKFPRVLKGKMLQDWQKFLETGIFNILTLEQLIMMEAVLKGLALGFVLALSVGPIIFTIIKQSLNNGHKGGFSFVAGVWVSDILLVMLSNTLTALVSTLLEHSTVIAYRRRGLPDRHGRLFRLL